MGIIRVLPEIIANKIAAGEVIERPASIIKELVENSLDAGAKKIEILVRHGGKSLIQVTDDGVGMSADDAEVAFQRHATSKIKDASDLDRIGSYGFRGEALPSIAAVSRVKLLTRKRDQSSGTEVMIEGGHLGAVKECAVSQGTTVEVRDLFFNTPARRKFMKSDATELGHVVDTISNLALSRLDVHFIFKSQDKIIFDLMPVSDIQMRAPALLGEETAKHLLSISAKNQDVKIWGVIGKPLIARANRLGQTFLVNGRWVKGISLSYALQAGYHGLLMQGQFPVAILFMEMDLTRVDVNVHPTKQEIRISNESQLKTFVKETVAERLAKEGDLAPQLEPRLVSQFYAPSSQSMDSKANGGSIQTSSKQMLAEMEMDISLPQVIALEQPIGIRGKLQITKILGQVHQTFILAETEEGMIVIDQHAAHERVQFEALMKNFKSSQPSKQRLLIDEILKTNPRETDILKNHLHVINQMGFELEEFGENVFAIRAVPSVLSNINASQVIKTFIEEKDDGKQRTQAENIEEDAAAMIACKRKSVKAHDAMSLEAIRTLLTQLSACDNPFSCPHGRPSFLKYSVLDLEKQFKRKL